MSVASSLLLLLILISLLKVEGRCLGLAEEEKQKRSNTYSSLDKVGEKARSHKSFKEVNPRNGELVSKENLSNAALNNGMGALIKAKTEKQHARAASTRILIGSKRKESKVRAQGGSLVSVSWRVPRSKQSQRHPGFNLDYSPPKTHPPSHN